MAELLLGRRRRYFGYNRNIANKVETPESAKSYRSIMSPVTRAMKRVYEPVKTFKPDPAGHNRFADKIMQRAVKTQIPGLLPALKNSPQFDEFEDNPIFFRSPDFEQNVQRSLYYLWLQKGDRCELCNIFDRHFKATEKGRLLAAKRARPTKGENADDSEFLAAQQEFLESLQDDPRLKARANRGVTEVPSRILRMNRKFQTSYWDPIRNKNLPDPYRRGKNKTPAFDSVCHEYFGIPDPDLVTCLGEYKRRYALNEELTANQVELNEGKEHLRRITLFGSLGEEEKRRGYKHIKQLKDYDVESEELWEKQAKLMVSAAEYINKIKRGRRFPTPPKEIQREQRRKSSKKPSSIDIKEYMGVGQTRKSSPSTAKDLERKSKSNYADRYAVQQQHNHHHHPQHHHKRHFHHNYKSDDFYMEMYMHFLNPDEDVSLKPPPKSITDVKELRKKMNLDEDHEQERKLVELINSDSMEELHIHGVHRKSMTHPHQQHPVTGIELVHEKELLAHHLERLNNPRLTHLLTKIVSQMSLTSSKITLTDSSVGSAKRDDITPPGEDDPFTDNMIILNPLSAKSTADALVEDLDPVGDIPEHELQLIMSEMVVPSTSGSSDNLSSGSSGGEHEEEEGEGETDAIDDGLKLFKKAKKKKDSLAELMDLTADFRATVCKAEEGKAPGKMNPFAEAVCVLYPDGADKKGKRKSVVKKPVYSAATLRKL